MVDDKKSEWDEPFIGSFIPERHMTDGELDKLLHDTLVKWKLDICPTCGRAIDRADCAWNTGNSESGSDMSALHIICLRCDEDICNVATYSGVETFEDFVKTVCFEIEWRKGNV